MAMCRPTRPRSTAPVTPTEDVAPTELERRAVTVLGQHAGREVQVCRPRLLVVEQPDAHDPARPARQQRQDAPDTCVADVGHEDRPAVGQVRAIGRAPDPVGERRHDTVLVREHVGVVPLRRDEDGHGRSVRVEVAGVLVRLDDEVLPCPEPGDAADRAGDRTRQDGPDEPGRVAPGADEQMEQPAGRRGLAVRASDGDEPPAPGRGRVGDDLLDALRLDPERTGGEQLRVIGLDGGHGLGDGQPIDDGRPVSVDDVAGVVTPVDRDAGGEHGRCRPDLARRGRTRSRSRLPHGRGAPRLRWPHHRRRGRGCASRVRSGDPGATERVRRRSPRRIWSRRLDPLEHAAPARRSRSRSRSRRGRPTTGGDGRRRRRRRRRRCRRARRACPACRRPVRRRRWWPRRCPPRRHRVPRRPSPGRPGR